MAELAERFRHMMCETKASVWWSLILVLPDIEQYNGMVGHGVWIPGKLRYDICIPGDFTLVTKFIHADQQQTVRIFEISVAAENSTWAGMLVYSATPSGRPWDMGKRKRLRIPRSPVRPTLQLIKSITDTNMGPAAAISCTLYLKQRQKRDRKALGKPTQKEAASCSISFIWMAKLIVHVKYSEEIRIQTFQILSDPPTQANVEAPVKGNPSKFTGYHSIMVQDPDLCAFFRKFRRGSKEPMGGTPATDNTYFSRRVNERSTDPSQSTSITKLWKEPSMGPVHSPLCKAELVSYEPAPHPDLSHIQNVKDHANGASPDDLIYTLQRSSPRSLPHCKSGASYIVCTIDFRKHHWSLQYSPIMFSLKGAVLENLLATWRIHGNFTTLYLGCTFQNLLKRRAYRHRGPAAYARAEVVILRGEFASPLIAAILGVPREIAADLGLIRKDLVWMGGRTWLLQTLIGLHSFCMIARSVFARAHVAVLPPLHELRSGTLMAVRPSGAYGANT
ncbi:uncharacterized protein BDR25DRAFT_349043 [Lindgomyces ingoldianus]|uniref:Uncharacterized protein n=1 Tax=Lindgomyces ingoldianus TaxID=673940 RepID=A0ACB6RD30_9PLEO|nr:uncharacterized protein BDR25DRAFT_349043 [Lindgomyces ingoldianus]KAF2477149.1 hypothetical protein BDR25DRAFT_349043 [Lindgomyces ingoldianus]